MLAWSSDTSLTGRRAKNVAGSVLRWVAGSKRRTLSIVSPKKSSRTGSPSPEGKMSMMPPRTAYSPGSITVSARP